MTMFRLFTTTIVAFIVLLITFSLSVAAAPVELAARDVWDPKVLYPHNGTVWKIGSCHNVRWDTSNPPAEITNPIGVIVLQNTSGYFVEGPGGLDEPLASGFNVSDGHAKVTVPNITPGQYQIVLFGDSGNAGQTFNITA